MKRLSLIIITSLLIMMNLSRADYHYASHTGSNTYPYTSWETAADSITAAMNAASPYDTIYIGAGEYNESVWAGPEDTCLTFIGAGTDSTRIWENTTANMWLASNNTLVRDIWFQVYDSRSMFGGWIGTSLMAYHCKFMGPGYGILAGGNFLIVEDCEFYDCEVAVVFAAQTLIFRNNYFRSSVGGTIFSADWQVGIIENNIFLQAGGSQGLRDFNEPENRTDTLLFRNNYIDDMLQGLELAGQFRGYVANNTTRRMRGYPDSTRNSDYSTYYHTYDNGKIIFRNNAMTESGYGITADHGIWTHDTLNIGYSGFWDNVYTNMRIFDWNNVDTVGNIYYFPMYANPDSYDVHLQAYSPFIDAGDPLILDVDGTRSDIGVFGGPGGTSYQYQDLPPRKPDSLSYRLSGDSLIIRWRMNYEADFWRYMINRDTVPNFTPWAGNIVAEPDTNLFVDFNWDRSHNFYYKIAAYDRQGNLSPYSSELYVPITRVEGNSGVEVPSITQIESNYPNPFNSSTTIIYTVANLGPIPAQINIDIYDIQGRKIRSLLNQREEVGGHKIIWDGRDDSGNELASGIYFARITQWNVDYLSRSQKLVLIR